MLTDICYDPTFDGTYWSSWRYDLLSYDDYGNIAEIESHDAAEIFNNGIIEQTYYTYDDAANLRQVHRVNYSAFPSIVTTHDYGYDGNNLRVSKSTSDVLGVTQTQYAYAKNGNLLGEYEPATSVLYGKEYFYLGSQLIASAQENQPPVADAGTDASVNGGQLVSLNGSGSADPDGGIVSYAWLQLAGTPVTLSDAGSVNPTFTAPSVSAAETLTFQLTVTDNDGATTTDTVNVQVQPETTPPVTTGTFTRTRSKGLVYYDITLSANEPATTHFRLIGQAHITAGGADSTDWQVYTGPISVAVDRKGTANFDYYSVDTVGNTEATKTEVLQ